jgi:uncharacterized protein (TIGR02598 family)
MALQANDEPRAFSLVEVMAALALLGVVFVALGGLLSVALQSSRRAMNVTICTQIARSLAGDLEMADFRKVLLSAGMEGRNAPVSGVLPDRYFAASGLEVSQVDPSRIYLAHTRVQCIGQLPHGETRSNGRAHAILTIQVAVAPPGTVVSIAADQGIDPSRGPSPILSMPFVLGGHSAK